MKQRQKNGLIVLCDCCRNSSLIPLVSFAEDNEEDKVLAVVG